VRILCFRSTSGTYDHLFLAVGSIRPPHLITVTVVILIIFGEPTNYKDYCRMFPSFALSLSFNFQVRHPRCVV